MLLVVIRSVDDVIACIDLLKELADLVRRGLAVVIKADEDIPAAVPDAAHQCRMLAEVLREVDGSDVSVRFSERGNDRKGIVRRGVVHEDNLILVGELRHGALYLVHNAADRLCRAVARDDKGYFAHLSHSVSYI